MFSRADYHLIRNKRFDLKHDVPTRQNAAQYNGDDNGH